MKDLQQWRGLKAMLQDAVEHGSRAVQQVHLETAKRPFAVLGYLPGVGGATRAIHRIHDVAVGTTYDAVRFVNGAVGSAIDVALDAVERARE